MTKSFSKPLVCFGLIAAFVCGGCGSNTSRSTSSGGASPSRQATGTANSAPLSEEIQAQVGEYMPPLEGGALEIAAPKGWQWGRAGSKHLVAFHPEGSSINDLPRILVSAEDSPYEGVNEVTADKAQQFLGLVSAAFKDEPLRIAADTRKLGDQIWVEYATLGKSGNNLVARQILQTVSAGRLYTIRLEVFDNQLKNARKIGLAVAASCRFGSKDTANAVLGGPAPSSEAETVDDPASQE